MSVSKDSSKSSTNQSIVEGKAKFKKKLKYNINEDQYAIAPVQWSETRPKPEFTPGTWTEDVLEDLARYSDWHKRHPNCASPRPLLDGEGAFGDRRIDEDNPKLFYTSSGTTVPPLPSQEFQPTYLGVDCDIDEVTTIAMSYEYNERLVNQFDNEDPWYTMSVKDTLEQYHIDGDHTTITWDTYMSHNTKQTTSSQFSKEAAWQKQQYGDYEGGYPAISRNYLDHLSDLALADKTILHPHLGKNKITPWEDNLKFSRFTEKGTALNEFNEDRLQYHVTQALNIHKKDVYRESIKMGLKSRKSNKNKGLNSKKNSSNKIVPLLNINNNDNNNSSSNSKVEDSYKIMRDKVGDDKEIEKISFNLIKLAKYVAKKAKIQKSAIDNEMDLVEACRKLRVMKVRVMLLSKDISPNMMTPEDQPIFIDIIEKAIKIDNNSGYLRLRHAKQDSNDRKKINKIISLLADRNDFDINTLGGKDGYAAVHLAAASDNSKLISWLHRHDADFLLPSKRDDMTPLMIAAKFGHVELMSEMIRKHVPVDTVNHSEGMSALHYAGMFGQTRAALFLLRIGCNKMLHDKKGRTAAECANEMKYLATAQAIAAFAREKPLVGTQLQFFVDTEVAESIKRSIKKEKSKKSKFNQLMDINLTANANAIKDIIVKNVKLLAKASYKYVRAKLFPNSVYIEEDEDDDGGYDSEEEEEELLVSESIKLKREKQKELINYNDPFSIKKKKPYDGVIVSDKVIWQRMSEKKMKEDKIRQKREAIDEEIRLEREAREAAKRPGSRSSNNSANDNAGIGNNTIEEEEGKNYHNNNKIKSTSVIEFHEDFDT